MLSCAFSSTVFVVAIAGGMGAAMLSEQLSAQVIGYPAAPPVFVDTPASAEAKIVNEASSVLRELTSGTVTAIPERLLASAEAIAIIPRFLRGAFVVGVSGGRGILIRRDINQQWQAPEFVDLFGGGIGWQIGVQATDLVLVFRSTRSLQNMQQGKVTLGGDVSVAAGPVGRTAGAATDGALRAEILSYSRSRGLYAGVSVNGSSLQLDVPAIQRYYQITPSSPGVVPPAAIALVHELNALSQRLPPVTDPALHSSTETSTMQPALEQPSAMQLSPAQISLGSDVQMQQRNAMVEQIATEIALLQNKLDVQWQEYLVLPASWKQPASITPEDIQSVVVRYERVAANPQFAALSTQPEFVEILGLLRQLASEAAAQSKLELPPPPRSN